MTPKLQGLVNWSASPKVNYWAIRRLINIMFVSLTFRPQNVCRTLLCGTMNLFVGKTLKKKNRFVGETFTGLTICGSNIGKCAKHSTERNIMRRSWFTYVCWWLGENICSVSILWMTDHAPNLVPLYSIWKRRRISQENYARALKLDITRIEGLI